MEADSETIPRNLQEYEEFEAFVQEEVKPLVGTYMTVNGLRCDLLFRAVVPAIRKRPLLCYIMPPDWSRIHDYFKYLFRAYCKEREIGLVPQESSKLIRQLAQINSKMERMKEKLLEDLNQDPQPLIPPIEVASMQIPKLFTGKVITPTTEHREERRKALEPYQKRQSPVAVTDRRTSGQTSGRDPPVVAHPQSYNYESPQKDTEPFQPFPPGQRSAGPSVRSTPQFMEHRQVRGQAGVPYPRVGSNLAPPRVQQQADPILRTKSRQGLWPQEQPMLPVASSSRLTLEDLQRGSPKTRSPIPAPVASMPSDTTPMNALTIANAPAFSIHNSRPEAQIALQSRTNTPSPVTKPPTPAQTSLSGLPDCAPRGRGQALKIMRDDGNDGQQEYAGLQGLLKDVDKHFPPTPDNDSSCPERPATRTVTDSPKGVQPNLHTSPEIPQSNGTSKATEDNAKWVLGPGDDVTDISEFVEQAASVVRKLHRLQLQPGNRQLWQLLDDIIKCGPRVWLEFIAQTQRLRDQTPSVDHNKVVPAYMP